MTLAINELATPSPALASAWRSILSACDQPNMLGLDVTSTIEWTSALVATHAIADSTRFTTFSEEDEIVGILPLHIVKTQSFPLRVRVMSPVTDLYEGRGGLLFKRPIGPHVGEMLAYLFDRVPGWDVFVITLVEGSESHAAFCEAVKDGDYPLELLRSEDSPYIVVANSWEEQFAALRKKFRWTVKSGRKNLSRDGVLGYRSFRAREQCADLFAAMFEIERESWKESAGTSITANPIQERFYREFLPVAADCGWLSGHLIELDSEPVAYVLGLEHEGVFYDLKESYKEKFKVRSPGHVLKSFVFDELCRDGIRYYDFMGRCDDYKMRWTDKTYRRSTYALYNGTLSARYRLLRRRLGRSLQRLRKTFAASDSPAS